MNRIKSILAFIAMVMVMVVVSKPNPLSKFTLTPQIISSFESMLFADNTGSVNGGGKCAGCTIVLTLVEQYSVIHEKSIEETMDELCSFLPDKVGEICTYTVNQYGDQVIALFAEYQHADDVCHALPNTCTEPTCRLFSNYTATYTGQPQKINRQPQIKKVRENPWDWLKNLINVFAGLHDPIFDVDQDKFSFEATFRGYNWRGKDCDDFQNTVYPGRVEDYSNPSIDANCNGIYGSNSQGQSYEELYCANSSAMGVAVMGDSVGAHFSIPPSYLTARDINSTTYKGIMDILETEFDWPMRSTYTGWEPSTSEYTVDSIYLRMRERNLCNHRDYQNGGVNGARSGDVANGNIKAFARNQETDKPVLFFLELVGNDVCSGHHDFTHMTTNEEFATNILSILQYLDTQLPKGSHIVFVGLAQGAVLWDSLWNRTHPIGATYEDVYGFLNCLQLSPCWGWMNDNETVRDYTSQRAVELSGVYNQLIANYTFEHFDMTYYDFPFTAINEEWIKAGGETWQLIEPVDGFHPNQIANYLMAEYFYDSLMTDKPDWLGPVNQYNTVILNTFGDQGGY